MDQQPDAFTLKRFEIMIDMSTKKMQNEIASLKETVSALANELGSLKSQVKRMEFSPQTNLTVNKMVQAAQPQTNAPAPQVQPQAQPQPQEQAKPADDSLKQKYGIANQDDVSIDKFFSFGKK